MHAEPVMTEQGEDTQTQQPEAETAEQEGVVAKAFGNIMDVLMPATPPEPKNVRIVRQFDLEAARTDPQPVAVAAVAKRPQPESRTKEEARAYRNRSLRAAAGFAD